MTILLGNRTGQSRWQALVFLAVLFDRATRDKILQFLVSSQAQHFFAAACSVSGSQILVHDVEKLLKLKGRAPGEDSNQLLSYQVRNTTGECVLLQNSHKGRHHSRFLENCSSLLRLVAANPKHVSN